MTALTFMGWLALSYIGTLAIPVAQLTKFNKEFTYAVDHNQSCFTRVAGIHGVYGKPSDYSLDLLCNYKLTHETVNKDVKVWRLSR